MLASETGRPLVQHVVDQAKKCKRISRVIVAADDQRIVNALKPFGTECMLTDPNHPSGTDRVAEAAGRLGSETSAIINVQGDEPEIEPSTIDALDSLLKESGFAMCTAATPFRPPAEATDPNLVKVVVSQTNRAMYFSRSPIPFNRDATGAQPTYYLHVGIYAYRRDTLIRLAGLKPTPCEEAEKLEQLRALENDIDIGVHLIERATHGIDTAQQYKAFVSRFKQPATSN
jgi:3-deoxy-manno-octulosonate cytidylyltransferase (CMP-KDO synthetase)